jgi:hypothetical protein
MDSGLEMDLLGKPGKQQLKKGPWLERESMSPRWTLGRESMSRIQRLRQNSLGVRLMLSFAVFLSGFYVDVLWGFWGGNQSLSYVVYAVLQVGGLIAATFSDIDANRYLKANNGYVFLFAVIWIGQAGLSAFTPGQKLEWHVLWIQALPMVYLLLRFKPIVEMRSGYLYATDICVAVLMANLISYGAWYFSNPFNEVAPIWPFHVLGIYEALGAVAVAVSYHYGEKGNPTLKLYMAAYTYLFVVGSAVFLQCTLDKIVRNEDSSIHMWMFGPIHIVPTLLIFTYRGTVLRFLGQQWLQERLGDQGVEFHMDEKSLGSITEVEQAIGGSDNLNGFCKPAEGSSDQYTLLHYACGNGNAEATRMLLAVETTAVNFASKRGGQSALYFAAQNGHVDCVRLLIEGRADVNQTDVRGYSPLYMAALMGHVDIVRLLIDSGAYGADLNQEIVLVAEAKGHVQVVELLLECSPDTDRWMGIACRSSQDTTAAAVGNEHREAGGGQQIPQPLLPIQQRQGASKKAAHTEKRTPEESGEDVLSASLLYDRSS